MTRAPRVPRAPKEAPEAINEAVPTPASSTSTSQTLETVLNWFHAVDHWSVAGYDNKLPRWVYLVAALILIDVL